MFQQPNMYPQSNGMGGPMPDPQQSWGAPGQLPPQNMQQGMPQPPMQGMQPPPMPGMGGGAPGMPPQGGMMPPPMPGMGQPQPQAFKEGGQVHDEEGYARPDMLFAHVSPQEIKVLDILQGQRRKDKNFNVPMYDLLGEDIEKSSRIPDLLWQAKEHTRRQNAETHAHGGHVGEHIKEASSHGRYGDTKVVMITPKTRELFDQICGYSKGENGNPKTGYPEYFNLWESIKGIGSGLWNGIKSIFGAGDQASKQADEGGPNWFQRNGMGLMGGLGGALSTLANGGGLGNAISNGFRGGIMSNSMGGLSGGVMPYGMAPPGMMQNMMGMVPGMMGMFGGGQQQQPMMPQYDPYDDGMSHAVSASRMMNSPMSQQQDRQLQSQAGMMAGRMGVPNNGVTPAMLQQGAANLRPPSPPPMPAQRNMNAPTPPSLPNTSGTPGQQLPPAPKTMNPFGASQKDLIDLNAPSMPVLPPKIPTFNPPFPPMNQMAAKNQPYTRMNKVTEGYFR